MVRFHFFLYLVINFKLISYNLTMQTTSTPLWNLNFILVFISNFLVFFCYYMLVPILPLYVMQDLGATESMAGVVVAIFTLASLCVRPISGFIVDKFSRKPLYFICYALFTAAFGGYLIWSAISIFIFLRIIQGVGFGLNTVGGLTLAIDVTAAERRGEGIGYFGVAYSVAMAIAPMCGLWLFHRYDFEVVFVIAFALSVIGLLSILPIRGVVQPHRDSTEPQKLSLGRFVLLKGLPCVAIIALSGYGYGALSNFMALYGKEVTFEPNVGMYFMIIASGIAITRVFSAKMINRGEVVKAVYIGGVCVVAAYAIFAVCNNIWVYYLVALLMGIGFGLFGSSFQAMLVNLAEPHQRGTASATYYIFWDMGIGVGIATGGAVLEWYGFNSLILLSGGIVVLALIYYALVSARYYHKNKLV